MCLSGGLIPLFNITRFTGRNTILESGSTASGLWNDVVDREAHFMCSAICTLKTISDKNILFAKGNPGAIKGSNQLDQSHHCRNFEYGTVGTSHRFCRILYHFDFAFSLQTDSALPMNHIQKRIVCIKQNAMCHPLLLLRPIDNAFLPLPPIKRRYRSADNSLPVLLENVSIARSKNQSNIRYHRNLSLFYD